MDAVRTRCTLLVLLVSFLTLQDGCAQTFIIGRPTASRGFGSIASAQTTPGIEFTFVPPFGSTLQLQGRVLNVSPAAHRVLVFIFIPGLGWYSKPSCASLLIPIASNGTWSASITTGGVDPTATRIVAFLVPATITPTCVLGQDCIGAAIEQQAIASVMTTRENPGERQIVFAGHAWRVKSSSVAIGPGPNYFSDSPENAWVDELGRLHVRITQRAGRWHCAEVIAKDRLGYGTYRWYLDSRVDNFDPNVVLGLFTWSDECRHREIDAEFSRWSRPLTDPLNAQYVVQPFSEPGNLVRFPMSAVTQSVHSFKWDALRGRILFRSLAGHDPYIAGGSQVVQEWMYRRREAVPRPGQETPWINLWLFNGTPPGNGQEVEVVINSFQWRHADDVAYAADSGDFDGDGKGDIAIWRGATGVWHVRGSLGGAIGQPWGVQSAGDFPVAGDYDGDHKADFAVWRASTGTWWILNSSNGSTTARQWGVEAAGDTPIPGDYDGDSRTDVAIWRPSTGTWWIINSSNGSITARHWGVQAAGDVPTPGDYDGDNRTDLAVWRESTGTWWIRNSSDGSVTVRDWGEQALGDLPTPADYDGDGKTDLAIWRASDGTWRIVESSTGLERIVPWGLRGLGDMPVPGDYDGDSKADIAIWRASTSEWFVINSSSGLTMRVLWGSQDFDDEPVSTSYVRK